MYHIFKDFYFKINNDALKRMIVQQKLELQNRVFFSYKRNEIREYLFKWICSVKRCLYDEKYYAYND